MPQYVYKCSICKEILTKIEKFRSIDYFVCSFCEKGIMHRQLFPPTLKFNGSGFFINDYKEK